MNLGPIERFWMRALGLSEAELRSPHPQIVNGGHYLQRHGRTYILLFTDLRSGKRVLACAPDVPHGVSVTDLQALDTPALRAHPMLAARSLAFADLDYVLTSSEAFKPLSPPTNFKIQTVTQDQVPEFFNALSEDDRDTLDLNLDQDLALGIHERGRLLGVARAAKVPDTDVDDITVVLAQSQRGRALAAPLVSTLVTAILKRGRVPRYRVHEDLVASRKVAERLGFVVRFQLLAWNTGLD